jgi:hypothetical protein
LHRFSSLQCGGYLESIGAHHSHSIQSGVVAAALKLYAFDDDLGRQEIDAIRQRMLTEN